MSLGLGDCAKYTVALYRFSRRRVYLLVGITAVLFVLNVLLMSNYLDLWDRVSTSFPLSSKCELKDTLAKTAQARMKTTECRKRLEDFMCDMDEVGWPVHEIRNTCPMFVPQVVDNYVGCYRDNSNKRVLKAHKYDFPDNNSPRHCTRACLRAGFRLAGVEYTSECFCGDDTVDTAEKIADDFCRQYTCPKSNTTACGGFEAIAVYATGVKEKDRKTPAFIPLPNDTSTDSQKKDVQILFLLQLNGRNLRQIRRLLRMIYSPKHLYYVHVDIRQKYMHKGMKEIQKLFEAGGLKNFHVTDRRFPTIWGGSSLLDMFLDVVRTTLGNAQWNTWDYILNLSETDMPLLSLAELEHNLASYNGNSFLSSHGYNTASFIQKQGFLYYFMECENRMWRIRNRDNFPGHLRIDGGSDWVVIHKDLAKYSISADDLPSQIRQFFTTILLPLEGFYHTLALNSEYCQKVYNRNLKLTNWKRKQGCRCAMLKKVVDWCGCSPLALREKEKRFNVQFCHDKFLFFARKFDDLIDIDAIAAAERQVLRFSPQMISAESPTYTFMWLNYYDYKVDGDGPRVWLYNRWAYSLYHSVIESKTVDEDCEFSRLREITAFKQDTNSKVALIVTIEDTCGNGVELLTLRRQLVDIANNTFASYKMISAQFGAALEHKEEVFKDFPALVTTTDTATIMWHWQAVEKLTGTNTSPEVHVQIFNPLKTVLKVETAKPYDSVNFAQFVEIDMKGLDTTPGTWTAVIRAGVELARVRFPVFSDAMGDDDFFRLTNEHYLVVDACAFQGSSQEQTLAQCDSVKWSTHFPDPKSDIPSLHRP